MSELTLEREFSAKLDTVFEFITKQENLVKWWGPEGMFIPEGDLDFCQAGPWYSVMRSDEGNSVKVSGHVTHVDPPNSVGFTWAWHDENDARGAESHVTISLTDTGKGTTHFVLFHKELADDDIAARHEMGWTSSLRKLEALI